MIHNTKLLAPVDIALIPPQKRILNTQITVDCFNIPISNCTHYFLSHFHADHYTKLNKSFKHPVYCCLTTANLVAAKLGAKAIGMEMYTNYMIDGFVVRLVEADHCPGAVCFIFLINGVFVLHTGDFRYNRLYHTFDIHFKCVYVDNTYQNETDFPSQNETIANILHRFDQKGKLCPQNICVLCCTYCVGKEKVFLSIAEYLDQKVQVSEEKMEIYRCYSEYTVNKINNDVINIIGQRRVPKAVFGFKKEFHLKVPLTTIFKKNTLRKVRNVELLPEMTDCDDPLIGTLKKITDPHHKDECVYYTKHCEIDKTQPFDRITSEEAPIKVISMTNLNDLAKITSKIYAEKIFVICGSGWKEKTEYKNYKRMDGKCIKKGIEIIYFKYSEHSSSSELDSFKDSTSFDFMMNTSK